MRRLLRKSLRVLLVAGAIALALSWAAPWIGTVLRTAPVLLQRAPATLPVPVAGVGRTTLADSWGAPRSGGRRHQGIDIFAPRGTPVHASTDGLVWRVGQNRLGGNVVWVLGPGRQLHYYAHLDRFADVRAGQFVTAGTALGYVGTTGNARGGPPHLHYGIYGDGGAINPFPLLIAPLRRD